MEELNEISAHRAREIFRTIALELGKHGSYSKVNISGLQETVFGAIMESAHQARDMKERVEDDGKLYFQPRTDRKPNPPNVETEISSDDTPMQEEVPNAIPDPDPINEEPEPAPKDLVERKPFPDSFRPKG